MIVLTYRDIQKLLGAFNFEYTEKITKMLNEAFTIGYNKGYEEGYRNCYDIEIADPPDYNLDYIM